MNQKPLPDLPLVSADDRTIRGGQIIEYCLRICPICLAQAQYCCLHGGIYVEPFGVSVYVSSNIIEELATKEKLQINKRKEYLAKVNHDKKEGEKLRKETQALENE